MKSNEQMSSKEDKSQKRGISPEMFYYEQVGSRFYLRFTRLTLILIIGLTAISIGMLLVLFFLSSNSDSHTLKDINVNITVPESSPRSSNQAIIPPALVPPQPKPNKHSRNNIPVPSPLYPPGADEITNNTPANKAAETKSNRNSNEQ